MSKQLLGIDYGRTFLGLAIIREITPQPLTVIKSKSDNHKIEEVLKICQKENISQIIIGFSFGKLANRITGFVNQLRKKTAIQIDFVDETLSTNQAFTKMIEQQVPQKKRRQLEHAYAAVVLLELFLQQK